MKILILVLFMVLVIMSGCADLTGEVFFNRKHQCGIWDHGRWDASSFGHGR